jgi:GxxExxY protein
MDSNKIYPHQEITQVIIGCAYEVYNTLGFGFLEKVYENALAIKIREKGLTAEQQLPIQVVFQGHIVGEYAADIFVEGKVIIELKACSDLAKIHEVQLVNYLKATGMKVGLLINFGDKIKIVRKVF